MPTWKHAHYYVTRKSILLICVKHKVADFINMVPWESSVSEGVSTEGKGRRPTNKGNVKVDGTVGEKEVKTSKNLLPRGSSGSSPY